MWAGYCFFSYLLVGVGIRDFRKYFATSRDFPDMSATTGCECGRLVIHTILKVRRLPISGKIRHFLRELPTSDTVLSIARLKGRPANCGKGTRSPKAFSERIADLGTRTAYDPKTNEIASRLGDLPTWRHKKLTHSALKEA